MSVSLTKTKRKRCSNAVRVKRRNEITRDRKKANRRNNWIALRFQTALTAE